ncbi:heat-inducible transcriptional repressor HrcA [Mesoaciditoga lauensis]|uniref:heat-inducible transcriptional repressor HrcA n=1 Tax=Mesoaciditoga lauensis TaxID=1495039 RepID=UPI0005613749|nr:heat-inducible transcriptional repressor HrcA [Mesoaciditoga lauensis]
MLNNRQKKVLFCVVNEYIQNRKPVSSSRILESTDISYSSATIRNDLKKLEYLGYVRHIHTSSGKVPTDKGYRFYIDSISELIENMNNSKDMNAFTEYPQLNVSTIINHAALLLSRTLPVVSVITKPRTDTLKIEAIRLHKTSDDYITVVLITEIGMIDTQTVLEKMDENSLKSVEKFLNVSLVGRTIEDIKGSLEDSDVLRKWKGTSVESVFDILKSIIEESSSETYVVRGLENLISDDLIEQKSLRRFVLTLESPKRFYTFLEGFGKVNEPSVFVGSEHPQIGMDDFSSFIAPYKVNKETVGFVLTIGAKAIDYQKAISTTRYVGNRLTEMFTFLSRLGRIKK